VGRAEPDTLLLDFDLSSVPYTVRIRGIHQNLTISIAFDGADATDAVERTGVWTYGSRVYIAAGQPGEARIYTLNGKQVKTIALPAGATVSETLTAGLYIVTLEGRTYKIVVY
jgi:hypothetical protein